MNDIRCPKCSGRLRITISATIKRKRYILIEVPEFPKGIALECVDCQLGFVGIRKSDRKVRRYAVNAAGLKEHSQDQWIIEQRYKNDELVSKLRTD